jgi:heme-degrading monooxygenase HmoA
MSYVVINAISVPADRSEELAGRFAGRAGMVEKAEGFERFELLRPADGREQWLVVTTWRDEPSFQGWLSSQDFGRAHGADRAGAGPGAGGGAPPAGHGGGQGPVSTASEVWSFVVEQKASAS